VRRLHGAARRQAHQFLPDTCCDESRQGHHDDRQFNPLGVKGLAELALCGVAPAIANAVYHATGKRVRALPITPEKLLA
jgi:hypothetical protein